jgi:hypothetical protein
MNTGRLPMRVCLWLGINPGLTATVADIGKRFDVERGYAWQSLEVAVSSGLLSKDIAAVNGHGQKLATYRAGPELLKLLEDA